MDINKKNVWIFVVIGMAILFVLVNFTVQPVYSVGCCWLNGNRTCGTECGWDGECTDEIKDECCMPVRMCSGYVTESPNDCYTRYCESDGYMCVPGDMDIATQKYTCECQHIYT